jgi:hypothetical protein
MITFLASSEIRFLLATHSNQGIYARENISNYF